MSIKEGKRNKSKTGDEIDRGLLSAADVSEGGFTASFQLTVATGTSYNIK